MIAHQAAELALANRVLERRRVLDAFGHVSVRSRERSDRFLLSRNLAPGLVSTEDVQEFDLDGETADPRPSYLERFIHAAVYAERPDVVAVVHSHAAAMIPLTVVAGVGLRPLIHMAAFLGDGASSLDPRVAFGDGTDLLIRTREMGRVMAEALGPSSTLLIRGHGFVTAADSLPAVVFQSVYAVENAVAQLWASTLGAPIYLSEREAATAAASVGGQVARAWDLWRREVGAEEP